MTVSELLQKIQALKLEGLGDNAEVLIDKGLLHSINDISFQRSSEDMGNKINVVLDATMLDTLQVCAAKFDMRFNMNKVPPIKAKPLDRGTLIHTGAETYYKALQESQPYSDAIKAMTLAMQVAAAESDLDSSDSNRAIEVMLECFEYWKDTDARMIIKQVEQSFMYVLHEDDDIKINMIGKIDLLVDLDSYVNLPVDHKSYDRDYPARRLTNQFLNYSYATGSNYLLVNKIGFQTSLKPKDKYKRIPLSYDPLILEQWKANVILIANQYIDYAASNKWPMNLTSCDKYNRICEYYPVCDSSGVEAKMYRLTADYSTSEVWDVSAALGKKS